ncbi:hypothetical protein HF888_12560 [Bermanella marisrubri]|uniref:STAS/SEC14 domain-containing protein n=1 Tax=Bermanella marisrubri TaxID=207949 RepID=Q1N029_9GAMM|nr:hypothetical protein [Bermanella marisrubri]EAT11534.1 hypothetical protein RED65_02649 [Oceanobacter sp. RED65] [Bermanella marisrubri]QIZ85001.1 hypothetical protein HF888_12560 [Bermanella marisrubri]
MQPIKHFYDHDGEHVATVLLESNQGLITVIWQGSINEVYYVQCVMDYVLQCTQQMGIDHWLWDLTQVRYAIDGAPNLIIQSLENTKVYRQVRQCAFISKRDDNPHRRKITQSLAEQGVEVRLFATQVKALDWLLVPDVQDTVWEKAPERQF